MLQCFNPAAGSRLRVRQLRLLRQRGASPGHEADQPWSPGPLP